VIALSPPFFILSPVFSSCANEKAGVNMALVLKKPEGAPRDSVKTADDSTVLKTFAVAEGISASDLAEAQTLQVTACLGLVDAPSSEAVSFASVRVRRARGHAIEPHLEISRALPRRATSPPPARPRLISCPSSSPRGIVRCKACGALGARERVLGSQPRAAGRRAQRRGPP